MKQLIRWTFIVLSVLNLVYAKRYPDRPAWLEEKLRRFRLPEEWVSHIGEKSYYVRTGRIRSWGRIGEYVTPGEPEAMAREFLRRHANAFGMKPDLSDIRLDMIRENIPGEYRVEFYQVYQDIPIYGTEIIIHIRADGKVINAYSGYKPNIKIDTVAIKISASQATQIALDFLQVQQESVWLGPTTRLLIFGTKVAYVISFVPSEPFGDWEVFVDAKEGEVIYVTDRACYYDGSGYVFAPDPLTTARVDYGAPGYTDNNDEDSDQLTSQRFQKTLQGLRWDSSYYYLDGPYVKITNILAFPDPVYRSQSGQFDTTRKGQLFEAVCAYYHIDSYERYLQSLGFSYRWRPIKVDPHGYFGEQSAYLPFSQTILFGEGGVDDAEDGDVIIHEYSHAMQHSLMGGFVQDPSYPEAAALREAYADYFAGSYSDSIYPGGHRRDWVFNWDGHNEFWDGRVLNSPKHYPEDTLPWPNYHKNGEIFSACLWEIFNQYGRGVTDRLALWSTAWLRPRDDFIDAAKKVLEADYWFYFSQHSNFIRDVFYRRGILRPPTVTLLFPNGRETLVGTSIETIYWSIMDFDELGDHIEIYYKGPTGLWHFIWRSPTRSTSTEWLIPVPNQPFSSKIKVVLCDKGGNPIAEDSSDSDFTIVPPPQITITRPNGGEIFIIGSSENITWSWQDPYRVISYLNLYFSTDNGTRWNIIAQRISNTGTYTWQIPNTPTTQALVKIIAYNSRGVEIKRDQSDGNFLIAIPPSCYLRWPNASGIVIEEGRIYEIRYDGQASDGIKEVKAYFSNDGGLTFPETLRGRIYRHPNYPTSVNNDTILWLVNELPTNTARIKIRLYSQYNLIAEDISDYNFTIRLGSPTNLTANTASTNKIQLRWYDNSGCEEWFDIRREDLETGEVVWLGTSGNGQSRGWVTWEDSNNIVLGHRYKYTVRAFREGYYSEPSNEAIGSVAYSNLTYLTRHNNQTKVISKGNRVHLVYFGRGFNGEHKIIYLHSSDGGNTWGSPEFLGTESDTSIYPAIAIDNQGRPHIVWAKWHFQWVDDGNYDWIVNVRYYYGKKRGENWEIREVWHTPIAEGYRNQSPPPPGSMPPPSFAIKGDSGFIAFKSIKGPPDTLHIVGFNLANGYGLELITTPILTTSHPTLNIDDQGRKSIVFNRRDSIYILSDGSGNWIIQGRSYGDEPDWVKNTTAIGKGDNLLIAWASCDRNNFSGIKFIKCQKNQSGYTFPHSADTIRIESSFLNDPPTPRIIDENLITTDYDNDSRRGRLLLTQQMRTFTLARLCLLRPGNGTKSGRNSDS
ncbi:MAG: hypothetical protein ABIK84_04475 [candidate division WOR-3 bacterium]